MPQPSAPSTLGRPEGPSKIRSTPILLVRHRQAVLRTVSSSLISFRRPVFLGVSLDARQVPSASTFGRKVLCVPKARPIHRQTTTSPISRRPRRNPSTWASDCSGIPGLRRHGLRRREDLGGRGRAGPSTAAPTGGPPAGNDPHNTLCATARCTKNRTPSDAGQSPEGRPTRSNPNGESPQASLGGMGSGGRHCASPARRLPVRGGLFPNPVRGVVLNESQAPPRMAVCLNTTHQMAHRRLRGNRWPVWALAAGSWAGSRFL